MFSKCIALGFHERTVSHSRESQSYSHQSVPGSSSAFPPSGQTEYLQTDSHPIRPGRGACWPKYLI